MVDKCRFLLGSSVVLFLFLNGCSAQAPQATRTSGVDAAQKESGQPPSETSAGVVTPENKVPPPQLRDPVFGPDIGPINDFPSGRPALSGGGGGNKIIRVEECGNGRIDRDECEGWLDSDKNPSEVAFSFIDLRNAPGATMVISGDDAAAFVTLSPSHTSNYLIKTLSQIIVSTNGFLDTGTDLSEADDFENVCPLPFDTSSAGDRFFVLHDDLEALVSVFYKYFTICPRSPDGGGGDGCHVFHWAPVQHYPAEFSFNTKFDIEAILYDQGDFVYQYADLTPEDGGNAEKGDSSTTGIQTQDASRFHLYACNTAGTLPDTGNLAVRLSFCGADCPNSFCGDGIIGQNESCDDGESIAGDGCSSDCQRECGDGVLDSDNSDGYSEECDEDIETSSCDDDCTIPKCGDGHFNDETDEDCDDGNTIAGDGCASTCEFECGNGVRDNDPSDGYSEECDTGGDSASCDENCTIPDCGDDYLNEAAGEECEDGNAIAGDGCSIFCKNECGDGVIDTDNSDGYSESCDTDIATALCDDDCTLASCGDGTVNPAAGESCDDGGESSTCDDDCTLATCGDGNVNQAAGETCDTSGETASCNANCTLAVCGDSIINVAAGEECDPPTIGMCDDNCQEIMIPD